MRQERTIDFNLRMNAPQFFLALISATILSAPALASASNQRTTSASCPMTPLAAPPIGIANGKMPEMAIAKTIAASDTSSSIVIAPQATDQITCGRVALTAQRDILYSRLALPNGGMKDLRLDILAPKTAMAARPLVVYISGGGFMMSTKESALDLRTYVAEAGFVVASIQYRTALDAATFRDSIADVKSAIRFLRANAADYGVDPKRVAVWGESAGGYLAAMVGVTGSTKEFDLGQNLNQSSAVQGVVDKFGASDVSKIAADFDSETQAKYAAGGTPMAKYFNGPTSDKSLVDDPTAHTVGNPLQYVDSSDPPFLIFHGSNDNLVSPSQTLVLHKALLAAGAPSKRYVLRDAGHGDISFLGDAQAGLPWSTNEVMGIIVAFLRANLH